MAAAKDGIGTLALDSEDGRRLAGRALPFGEAASSEVTCLALDAPEGAVAVPIALGSVLWRSGGALRLTVVVRAAFSIRGTPPAPTPPDPFRTTDAHHRNRPLAHVVAASDRVPWKRAVDVTVIGHARAPGGRPVPEMAARISLRQGGAVALDKAVRVVGDRREPGAPPKAFDALPIVWERALGGRDAPANPIGCSQDDDEQPNVLDPASPTRPAGFGPLADAWRIRSHGLGDGARKMLDEAVIVLPEGFDTSFFQAAPPDQTLPQLAPDAVLVLEGFHAERPRVEIPMPGARAAGAVYGLDAQRPDAPAPLAFRADTVHVDADRWLCSLTWRAFVDVRDEVRLGHLLVAAGVGMGSRVPVVPDTRPPPKGPAPRPRAPARAAPLSATLELAAEEAPRATLPFGKDRAVETLVLGEPTPAVEVPSAAAPEAPAAAPTAPPAAAVEAKPPPQASPWGPAPPEPRPPPPREEPPKVDIKNKLYRNKR